MFEQRKYCWWIATACAFVVLVVQMAAIRYGLIGLDKAGLGQAGVALLLNTGLYLLLFKSALALFQNYGWKLLFPQFNLAGQWDVLIVSQNNEHPHREGRVTIHQTADVITIRGENWEADDTGRLKSMWRSSDARIKDNTLFLTYSIRRTNAHPAIKEGLASFHLDGSKPPLELRGIYTDVTPSEAKGEVRWRRVCGETRPESSFSSALKPSHHNERGLKERAA